MLALCRAEPAGASTAALCHRVECCHPELFTFVADPAAPPTHNAAERAPQPLVVARKVSGGTRSPRGSRIRAGSTTNLRDFAASEGIDLDGADAESMHD